MTNSKCGMFKESKLSRGPSNIVLQILIFIAVFIVIMFAESIVTSIFALPEMLREMNRRGLLDAGAVISIKESIEIATIVSAKNSVMIPSLLGTVLGTLLSIIYCRFIEKRSLGSIGMRKKNAFRNYLMGLAVGFVLISAIVLIAKFIGAVDIQPSRYYAKIVALYLLGFGVQGMSEEFIFRGYLMNTIGGKHSAVVAVAVSSVAFSLAHIMNPGVTFIALFNIALFGVFASLYMIRFDDIWGASAIHSIWNFTQGNIYGISVSGTTSAENNYSTIMKTSAVSDNTLLTGGDFGIEASIITTVVLLIACGVMAYLIKKNSNTTDSCNN